MSNRNVHKLPPEPERTYVLMGISSHENDYRLTWAINEHLGLHFTKSDNLNSFNQRLNITQEFSVYCYSGENNYSLISNRCENGFLLEELKNIDYLLKIEETDSPFPVQDFISKLRGVSFISAIFKIDPHTLKNRKRLT